MAKQLRACRWLLLLFAFAALHASAQVYEVHGGNSSLFQASGGSLTVTGSKYNLSVGAGYYAGHFESGVRMERAIGGATVIAGDDHLNFNLPTDIFDAAHYLYTRGISVDKKIKDTDVLAFAGVDSATFSNPLFLGAKSGSGVAFLSLHRAFNRNWQVFSDTVISRKQSEIMAVQWTPHNKTDFALSAGIGSNAPYAAASVAIDRRWLDLKASYVQASREFHRFALNNPILSEPEKGNLSVTITPTRYLSFNGAIQNYLIPLDNAGNSASSASDEVGVNLQLFKATLSGSLYESKFQGFVDHAGSASLQRFLTRRIELISTYMASRPQGNTGNSNFMTTVSEVINQRITLNQSISTSGGSPTLYYGGSFQSNLLSFSANYETFYIPARTSNPFENAFVGDFTLRLFGRYRLHGQSNVGPTGHILYTADIYALLASGAAAHRARVDTGLDHSILRIEVLDDRGEPVDGAAVMIDQRVLYTDSHGLLFLRERHSQTHKLFIELDQFLAEGWYEIMSAPSSVTSTPNEDAPPVDIILRRVKAAPSRPGSH